MARKVSGPEWWKLSDMGDAEEKRRRRYSVSVELGNADSWKFCLGARLPEDHPTVRAVEEDDPPAPVEDMPWGNSRGLLVSDRLRRLIEREAPEHVQFVPAAIRTRQGTPVTDRAPFWMMNVLRIIDCTDYEASEYTIRDEPDGTTFYSFDVHVTDSRMIPDDVVMTRILQFANIVLVRDSLRRAILDAGMTGCQFYETAVR